MPGGTDRARARRGYGEGSVYRDGDYWVMTVELGRDAAGKRVRRKVKARTKAEVMRRTKALQEEVWAGVVPGGGALPLASFIDTWLDTVVASRVGTERTVDDYRGVMKRVQAGLGHFAVAKLQPEHVDRFLRSQADAGYSKSYVGRMRMLLADCLTHAERRGMVVRNAASLSVMPKCKPAGPRRAMTADEVRAFVAAAKGERLEPLVICGLVLGLRPGELTGLRWCDVEFEGREPVLSVTGSLKRRTDSKLYRGPVKRSTAGERTVALPPVAVRALHDQRRRQAEERLAAGPLWQEGYMVLGRSGGLERSDAGQLVFTTEIGTALDPADLRRTFLRVARRARIGDGERVFPYLMRHTAVSHLLDGGASIEEIADLTGDDPVTLYRHYRHRIRPVASVAVRLQGPLGLNGSQDGSPDPSGPGEVVGPHAS